MWTKLVYNGVMTVMVPPLRYISTPVAYMGLLRTNMQKTDKVFSHLKGMVEKHHDLHGLILRGMKDIDENQRLDKIISSLGWLGVRDRLACHYLFFHKNNYYDSKADLKLLNEVLSFENRLLNHTVEGYSRAFMLGFYLQMLKNHLSDYMEPGEIFSITDDTYELLKISKIKTLPIDWVVLALQHFNMFFGKIQTHQLLLDGVGYHQLYNKLDEQHQNIFNKNMVVYAASIGERKPFLRQELE